MQNLLVALVLAVASLQSAWAFESRFDVDPNASLAQLERSGLAVMTSGRNGNVYWADASAVLHVDIDKMFAAAQDYEHYVQFGMPHLNESHIVTRESPELLYTWASMSIATMSSQHYLEVRVHPALGKGRGMEWQLTPKQAGWPYAENSAFSRSDGSFYLEALPGGAIYVRYFLTNDVDVPLGGLFSGFIQSKLRQGAADVISALARQAH